MAFLELASLAAIVATITIVFRSMIAAIVPVFLVGITCSMLQAYFGAAIANVPMPSIAADDTRALLFAGAGGPYGIAGFGTQTGMVLCGDHRLHHILATTFEYRVTKQTVRRNHLIKVRMSKFF